MAFDDFLNYIASQLTPNPQSFLGAPLNPDPNSVGNGGQDAGQQAGILAQAAAAGAQGAAAQGGRSGTTQQTRNSGRGPAEESGGAQAQTDASTSSNARRGSFNPSAAGKAKIDPSWRQNKLFDYGDPAFAMQNALRDMGINPYRQNPFIADFMRAAPGLANAHIIQNAGARPEDVDAMGGTGAMFGSFLQDVLGRGAINSTLRDANSALGSPGSGVFQTLSTYLDNLDNGGAVNPYLNMLYERMDNPNEMGNLLGSLTAPRLGPALGQSYQRGLGASLGGSYRNYIKTGDPATDWWTAIMAR